MEQLRLRQLVVLGIAASLAAIIAAIGIIGLEDTAQSAPRVSTRSAYRYWFLVSSAFYELHKTAPSLDSMFSGPNTYIAMGPRSSKVCGTAKYLRNTSNIRLFSTMPAKVALIPRQPL